MQIIIIFLAWIIILYIIKLNKEIYFLKKRVYSNKEIYVPSYREVIQNNVWYLQLGRIIINKLMERRAVSNYKKVEAVINNNID